LNYLVFIHQKSTRCNTVSQTYTLFSV
ncbi:rhs element Vgr family protein, partial [Vibrio parahaemolyticus V-223/04]